MLCNRDNIVIDVNTFNKTEEIFETFKKSSDEATENRNTFRTSNWDCLLLHIHHFQDSLQTFLKKLTTSIKRIFEETFQIMNSIQNGNFIKIQVLINNLKLHRDHSKSSLTAPTINVLLGPQTRWKMPEVWWIISSVDTGFEWLTTSFSILQSFSGKLHQKLCWWKKTFFPKTIPPTKN